MALSPRVPPTATRPPPILAAPAATLPSALSLSADPHRLPSALVPGSLAHSHAPHDLQGKGGRGGAAQTRAGGPPSRLELCLASGN